MTRTMVASDGCRIAFQSNGDVARPTLLLINALGSGMDMWHPHLEDFASQFHVVRHDTRGQHGSDSPAGDYSIARMGLDVIELLDHLGIDRAHICGHSLGGLIGLWLADQYPDRIDKLVLTGTSLDLGHMVDWDERMSLAQGGALAALANDSIGYWFTADFRWRSEHVIRMVETFLLHTQPDGYAGCCAAMRDFDARHHVAHLSAPAMVVASRQDPLITRQSYHDIASAIAGCRFLSLDAAHLACVEQPAAFTKACMPFLLQQDVVHQPVAARCGS